MNAQFRWGLLCFYRDKLSGVRPVGMPYLANSAIFDGSGPGAMKENGKGG
jgi:hypothetical protein